MSRRQEGGVWPGLDLDGRQLAEIRRRVRGDNPEGGGQPPPPEERPVEHISAVLARLGLIKEVH